MKTSVTSWTSLRITPLYINITNSQRSYLELILNLIPATQWLCLLSLHNLRGIIRAPWCKYKRAILFPKTPKTPKTLKFILRAWLQDASFDCLCPTHLNLIKCRCAALLMLNYVFTMQIACCLFSSYPPILMFFPPRSQHHYVADSCWGVISVRLDHKRTEKMLGKTTCTRSF